MKKFWRCYSSPAQMIIRYSKGYFPRWSLGSILEYQLGMHCSCCPWRSKHLEVHGEGVPLEAEDLRLITERNWLLLPPWESWKMNPKVYFLNLLAAVCHMWDISSPTGDWMHFLHWQPRVLKGNPKPQTLDEPHSRKYLDFILVKP